MVLLLSSVMYLFKLLLFYGAIILSYCDKTKENGCITGVKVNIYGMFPGTINLQMH
ncbi:Uncharacterised protein [Escherichia coli]|nr:Uncharacterised protein [Escherichia coli]SQM88460.1 Uncharacterised protein [Escherichia coli]SQN27474.1 Uncharacterised protein [Escherichia coli]SQP35230.1 Uncharacterised protein [Escherichia coli]SQQ79519.1 Uncharacterised protein [Escherichia coli]